MSELLGFQRLHLYLPPFTTVKLIPLLLISIPRMTHQLHKPIIPFIFLTDLPHYLPLYISKVQPIDLFAPHKCSRVDQLVLIEYRFSPDGVIGEYLVLLVFLL